MGHERKCLWPPTPYHLNASLAEFAKLVQLRLKLISRELQLNRSLAAADWRQREPLSGRSAMTGIAHGGCGSLRAEATGEPALPGVCHLYPRRTGSAFGVATRPDGATFHLEPDQ